MKLFLIGFTTCAALVIAWKYRATIIPWLRTEEQKATDALLKRKA